MRRLNISNFTSVLVLLIVVVLGCAEVEKPSLDAETYLNRGNAYSKKGQYDHAISDFTKAIEINPRYALAYNNRGIVMRKLGNIKMACSDAKRACELGDCGLYELLREWGDCE